MYQWLKSGSHKRPIICEIEEDNNVNDINKVQVNKLIHLFIKRTFLLINPSFEGV